MLNKTNIAWTERTWNPVRGCTQCSAGCENCYAKTLAERLKGQRGFEAGFALRLAPHKLLAPLSAKTPFNIFVNSMSDVFHPAVPTDYIADIIKVMAATPWHTYQVLTKRHQRMKHLLTGELAWGAALPNVWWGVSVENRAQGFPRIQHLQAVPTENRFLSIEPLLEDLGQLCLTGISWVIVGGETGDNARPMGLDWARSIRDQAIAAKIPFFFKQEGARKGHGATALDGVTWAETPSRLLVPVAPRLERLALVGEIRAKYRLTGTLAILIDPTATARGLNTTTPLVVTVPTPAILIPTAP